MAGLEESFCVEVLHELTPELAELAARAAVVVFVDARAGLPAGEVATLWLSPGEGEPSGPGLTHALSPQAVLALAEALYGRRPPAFLVTVNGRDFELGEGLSSEVARALPGLRARVVELASSCPKAEV